MTASSVRSDSGAPCPAISVLLPVFNAERYVHEAVTSVLAQTFGDFELLITDDGSTDGSLAVLRRLAASDARIHLVSRSNRGLVHTLNEMLDRADGRFIARMDADDRCVPHRFQVQMQAFARYPELVALGSAVDFMDPAGRRLQTCVYPLTSDEIEVWTMKISGGSGMSHPTLMVRESTMRALGGYREEFWPAEDADLILRLLEHGRVANLAQPLLSYRMHAQSISHQNTSRQRDAHYRAAVAAAKRRMQPLPDPALSSVQSQTPEGEVRRRVKWAWWALGSGHVATARVHALNALLRAPFDAQALRAFACAIRGH